MIIIRLMGGLGNQLFQYAFGRRVSVSNNVEVKLDALTGFTNDFYRRRYLLSNFPIVSQAATCEDLEEFGINSTAKSARPHMRVFASIKRRIGNDGLSAALLKARSIYFRRYGIIYETKHSFDPNIMNKRYDHAYFCGYWQSERYFEGIEQTLRDELVTDFAVPEGFRSLEDEIGRSYSVGVHLRRYDLVPGRGIDTATAKVYAEPGADYYSRAFDLIDDNLDRKELFVFSDDIDWARRTLMSRTPLRFVHTGSELADFRLLSGCQHQIIANSTFSWWAAWLNKNKNKIVIAPRRWFRRKHVDLSSLYPASWKTI